ncbi:hypothetical protein KsCSTR_02960 [Candidatus Kuenenia stuttgartiensis]|uniref:Uncharacterized protein n=1 Tax=Kuenenia stuttgartiensis TaxID=174633 RepID=Q1PY15_KUEST|nr:hypothetical protein [Candidatus Kuenenia stuttgartiensis]RXF34062.1 hypothetical protein EG868_07830 [Enterococcus faecalis]QII09675.1 hypothetical protein KsCSTR_02960 [Candidatus Kuenenia stuttgartiensis]TVM01587.1 MAG: hypothetical protein CV080_04095 [Candidatus Kuenenia stuttgartiensis]CAJ72935.1 unknown protein [Candidatus Kuenenia stuttgartiensis]
MSLFVVEYNTKIRSKTAKKQYRNERKGISNLVPRPELRNEHFYFFENEKDTFVVIQDKSYE